MPRISPATREGLAPEDQQYFDAIVGSRGSIRGPYGVLLNSPKLAARVADTGAFVRFEFDVPEALKETVIIASAKEMESQYEFSAHARLAREAGVSEETIKAIANGSAPAGLSGDEALLVGFVHDLLRNHKVSDATFSAMTARFGERDTLHFTVLVGHYLLVAQVLTAFDVELGPGMVKEIPD
jgi:4-carboxymuconolactone decarboxylase